MPPKKLLVIVPFDDGWTWLSDRLTGDDYAWRFLRKDILSKGRKALVVHALRGAFAARRHDVVITHGPWLALFVAFFMRLAGIRRPHLAFTFNHGNGLFFTGIFLRIARFSLPGVTAFITHSSRERVLFHEKYGIPLDKLLFTHWAIDPPMPPSDTLTQLPPERTFVCCIGRNNRNLPLFLDAVRQAGFPAVIVAGAHQIGALDPRTFPPGLLTFADISADQCNESMGKAAATVIPLIDDLTGAGHRPSCCPCTSAPRSSPPTAQCSAII